MSAGKRSSTYWFTHKFFPSVAAASIMALAAFVGPVVEFLLHAPGWVWGIIIAALALVAIVWLLRLEAYRMAAIERGEHS